MESLMDVLGDFAREIDRGSDDLQRLYNRAERTHMRRRGGVSPQCLSTSDSSHVLTSSKADGTVAVSALRCKGEDVSKMILSVEGARFRIQDGIPLGEIVESVKQLAQHNDEKLRKLEPYFQSKTFAKQTRKSKGKMKRRSHSFTSECRSRQKELDCTEATTSGYFASHLAEIVRYPPLNADTLSIAKYPRIDSPRTENKMERNVSSNVCRVPTLDDCGLSSEALALLKNHDKAISGNQPLAKDGSDAVGR